MNIRPRKLGLFAAASIVSLAGVGGLVVHTAHAAGGIASVHKTVAVQTGAVQAQLQDQTGSQTGVDSADSTAPEASSQSSAPEGATTGTEAAGASDPAGGADVQSGPNDQSGSDVAGNG